MKLSILICTLEERKTKLSNLLSILKPQLSDDVEVLTESDNREITTGEKRNKLLDRSQGEYVAFIDDDDLVSNNYIELIIDAINKSNPDVIGIHLLMTTDGEKECRTYHSLKYDHWWEEADPDRVGRKRYFRNPNHLNPIKREIAMKVKFPLKNRHEDRAFSMEILPYLKTEENIEQAIYYYLFKSGKK